MMQQPMIITIPWPVVAIGLILAITITALILTLTLRALGRWRRNLEEDAAVSDSYRTTKKKAEKFCPAVIKSQRPMPAFAKIAARPFRKGWGWVKFASQGEKTTRHWAHCRFEGPLGPAFPHD